MKHKDVDYLVIGLLFLCGLYQAITGLVMDLFGFPRLLWHNYAGYALVVLVGLHLALNWDRIKAYAGNRLGRARPRGEAKAGLRLETPSSLGRRRFLLGGLGFLAGLGLGRLLPRRYVSHSVGEDDSTGLTDLGQAYHEWSKPGAGLFSGSAVDWGSRPAHSKRYPGAALVPLPEPVQMTGVDLAQAIAQRRSRRDYLTGPLSLGDLSSLLYAANGISQPVTKFRTAPSAGALYPIETYAVVSRVHGLDPGLYHYVVESHGLEQLWAADLRVELTAAGLGQQMLAGAAVCFVLSAVWQRTRWKYRERSYRYVMLEAGHIGQNIYLAATGLGLGACAVGAFLDEPLNTLLGLNGETETALYMLSAGRV